MVALPHVAVKLLVGAAKLKVIARVICSWVSDVGFVGFAPFVGQLLPGQLSAGDWQATAVLDGFRLHDSKVFVPNRTTLVSGVLSVAVVKPFMTTRSLPLPSRSKTEKTKFGSVTAAWVVLS